MTLSNLPSLQRWGGVANGLLAVGLLTSIAGLGSAALATDTALAVPLCGALKKVLPEVRNFAPVGVQAQLVMSIANIFDYDGKKLGQVQAEIDAVTSANCPKERTAMLALLKMKSLAEALR